MATATANGITLELSSEEASLLLYICNNIGGSPTESPRDLVDNIAGALTSAGVVAAGDYKNRLHSGDFYLHKTKEQK